MILKTIFRCVDMHLHVGKVNDSMIILIYCTMISCFFLALRQSGITFSNIYFSVSVRPQGTSGSNVQNVQLIQGPNGQLQVKGLMPGEWQTNCLSIRKREKMANLLYCFPLYLLVRFRYNLLEMFLG